LSDRAAQARAEYGAVSVVAEVLQFMDGETSRKMLMPRREAFDNDTASDDV
jgi:xanthine/CO dehydrogenase XdhC/CoxF family maturation factor